MKLFQQLLVAPAAVGFLATGASAADLNINGVSDYADASVDGLEQVTSITQFSDVYPTDWAYQALSNLVERYGCVAGYPNGTFRGNRAMTRYEAAALLNACLDRITEVTDELRRLIKEFETELAIIRGRVDGLEARVGELEATQFSTTTKLKGTTHWVFGGTNYYGKGIRRIYSDKNGRTEYSKGIKQACGGPFKFSKGGKPKPQNCAGRFGGYVGSSKARAEAGATSFSYDLRLHLETSFTGKDLLMTRIRSGNMNNPYGGNGPVGLISQEYGVNTGNKLVIDRLFYKFPIGESFTAVAGPRVRMDNMLPVWPSAYPSDMTMDFFTYAGAPGVYNLALGAGAGIWWENDGFSVSTSYLSQDGNKGNPEEGGIMTDGAGASATTQVAYSGDGWGIAGGYTYASGYKGGGALYGGNGTPSAVLVSSAGNSNSYSVSAWWTPMDSSWIPSISTGWGMTSVDKSKGYFKSATTQSWYVGLQWADVFVEGNDFGMAVGQPTFVTDIDYRDYYRKSDFVADGQYAFEWWYKFQVTDNITVTPAVYYLSKPYGDVKRSDDAMSALGGLVKTTFKF